MCYAKPGPRCTAHARADLQRAQERWDADPSEKNFKALEEARRIYDSTPGGQKELSAHLATQDDDAVRLRIDAGKMLRAKQRQDMLASQSQGFLPERRLRKGINDPEDAAGLQIAQDLIHDASQWRAQLDDDENNAVHWYQLFGHESVTPYLTFGPDSPQWKEAQGSRLADDDRAERVAKKNIALLDSALAKAPRSDEPQILYRSFRVPGARHSDTPGELRDEYVKSFEPGATISFPSYMSTSVDSDLMIYNTNSGRRRPDEFIVFEILSNRGVSLHDEERHSSLQSLEREMLLPRDSKMRVVKVIPRTTYANSRPNDFRYHHTSGFASSMAGAGRRVQLTVVQLLDITED